MKFRHIWNCKFNSALTTVFSIAILVSFPIANVNADLVSGLQGYWQFENDGSDSSTAVRDLTVNTGTGFNTGLIGQAIDFTGKDQNNFASRAVDDSVFDIGSGDFSIQLWVNYQSTASEQILAEKWTGAGGPGWTLTKLNSNAFRFHFDSAAFDSSAQSITAGEWNQVVARRTGTQFDLLFNDNSIFSQDIGAASASDVANVLLIGKRNPADNRNFSNDSFMDEVAFWDRALTDQEVTSLYNGGQGRLIGVPEPSTMGLLSLFALTILARRRKL